MLTNAVADSSAGHRADLREADKPLTTEDVAADLKQQETLVEAYRTKLMRVMKELSIIDPSVMGKHAGENTPPHPEFLRAKRAYDQQLGVLNHAREEYLRMSIPKVAEDPRQAPVGTSPVKLERNDQAEAKFRSKPLINLPAALVPPIANQPPESRWASYFWLIGCIAILLLMLLLMRWLYANRERG